MHQDCYMNRELSWLAFNRRVLLNASDENVPLCERLNFFSIFQSNLDEFFMVRIGSLHDQKMLDDGSRENKTGMTPSGQIDAALDTIRMLCREREDVYNTLLRDLAAENIHIIRFREASSEAEEGLRKMFQEDVLPYISHYSVSRKEEFPFLNNRAIYAIATLRSHDSKFRVAVIPCEGTVLPRLIPVPASEGSFMLLEELILHFLPDVFPDDEIIQKSLIRVTRNADIDADVAFDEDLSYLDHMEDVIKQRKRLCPVRLELSRTIDATGIYRLCEFLNISANQVFEYQTPLDLSFMYQFIDMLRGKPALFYPPRSPRKIESVMSSSGQSMMAMMRKQDILLHYPYDSFNPFLRLLHEAAADPQVRSIRMTLYRVARNSQVAQALAEAAENGKDVKVFVELKARFDEENNIEWSRRLEEAGCHVNYGIEHIKVHSKLCLITRMEEDGQERIYTQIGTGNYNEKTSRIYTDLSLFTYDQQIGADGINVFEALFREETVDSAVKLFASPNYMEQPLVRLVDEEIRKGTEGRIRLKMNSLTDKVLIDKLIEASCAGVRIDMVIRGICCLLPGVKGMTENIRVISIVGRYLEHSRIYLFGSGEDTRAFISSADWMTRNMTRRVEIACPVEFPPHVRMLNRIMDTLMRDTEQSWSLDASGDYIRRGHENTVVCNAQDAFHDPAFIPLLP